MKKILKWLDNFWYHYKWTVLIGMFVLSLVIIGVVQMLQKEEYDASFMYLGEGSGGITATQYSDIQDTLIKVTDDYSKDGEINVLFSRLAYESDSNGLYVGSINSDVSSFMSSMLYQQYYIYFISESVYDIYKDTGLFVKLEDILGEVPEYAYDAYTVKLSDTDFGKSHAGVSGLPDNTLVALKTVPYYASGAKTKNETMLMERHAEIFEKMMSYTDEK